jgi:type I restriction enzyme S subunit
MTHPPDDLVIRLLNRHAPANHYLGANARCFRAVRQVTLFARRPVILPSADFHHRYVLLFGIAKGAVVISGERRHVLRAGQALLIPPFTLHRYEPHDGERHPIGFIGFEADVGDDSPDCLALNLLDTGTTPISADAWQIVDRIETAMGSTPGVVCGYHLTMIRPEPRTSGSFLRWLFGSRFVRARFEVSANGLTRVGLGQYAVDNVELPVPPTPEQHAIAAVLDRETAKIEALVAEQERLIDLLKEKRQAVISHAVTRGLNPAAPMKDSGIEWLGEVPAHWEVKRLKQVSPELTVGIVVEPSKLYADDGIPALRSLNVAPGAIKLDNLVFITPDGHQLHSKSRLNAGDLVAVRSGQPGTTAVIPAELDGCNCIDLIIIRRPRAGSEKFLCWYLASEAAVHQFSLGSGGAIQQHFNVGTASDLVVPVPSPAEQIEIAVFLDRETARVDLLTTEAQRAIDLLQERRTALISAAVTGQIDVRPADERASA